MNALFPFLFCFTEPLVSLSFEFCEQSVGTIIEEGYVIREYGTLDEFLHQSVNAN